MVLEETLLNEMPRAKGTPMKANTTATGAAILLNESQCSWPTSIVKMMDANRNMTIGQY